MDHKVCKKKPRQRKVYNIDPSASAGTRISSFTIKKFTPRCGGYTVFLLCDCGRETRLRLASLLKGAPRCICRTATRECPAALARLDPCCLNEKWEALLQFRVFVSSCGRCFSVLQNRLIGSSGRGGYVIAYLHINRQRVGVFIHRLVLLAFTGPCPGSGFQTRHLDGNPSNKHLTNLRWGTPLENMNDKRLHGTVPIGSRHPLAKLTEADIPKIRELYRNGLSQSKIGKLYKVQQMTVCDIVRGRIWKHV